MVGFDVIELLHTKLFVKCRSGNQEVYVYRTHETYRKNVSREIRRGADISSDLSDCNARGCDWLLELCLGDLKLCSKDDIAVRSVTIESCIGSYPQVEKHGLFSIKKPLVYQ